MDEQTKDTFGQSLWFGLYWGVVGAILRTIFKDAFSFSGSVAFTLSILLTALAAYPIFMRGIQPVRKFWFMKADHYSFWHHAVLSFILSAVAYAAARIFGWN